MYMGETTARILYSGFVLWFKERNKVFLEKGYNVTAIDCSIELFKIASEYTGIEVKHG